MTQLPSNRVAKLSSDPVTAAPRTSGTHTPPTSLLFVSPSTRENSTAAQLDHPNMQKLCEALRAVGHSHQVATGHWSDGAEEVAVAKVPSHLVAKLGAKLGYTFRQKAVLWFTPGDGADKLHKVTGAGSEELKQRGIPFHTVLQDGSAFVVDEGGKLGDRLTGLPHHSINGTANFLGGDTREEAAEAYKHVLGS